MFLGLVGVPTGRLSYEAFKAARAIAGVTGALFTGVSAAAVGGIVTTGAAILGAGAFGFFVGQKILESLEPDPVPELPLAQTYRVPGGQGNIRVIARSKAIGQPEQIFDNIWPSPMVAPVIRTVGVGVIAAGVLVGEPLRFEQYVGGGGDLFDTILEIVSVTKQDGSPAEGLRKIPGIKPQTPALPVKVPTPLPIPNLPDFPVTPTVVPNPDSEPEREGETREPGVIVQVPELGLQFNFGLDGVRIDRYKAPNTEPFEVPKVPPPPTSAPPANDPCPCPEGENKDEEIICRIKALQTKLLDDGFTLDLRIQSAAQSLEARGFTEEFRFFETSVATLPSNAKRIRYPEPGRDSVFSGNVQFLVKGIPGEVIPIRDTSQILIAPKEADGYIVSGNEGFTISAAAYLYTKKPYIDAC